MIRIQAVGKNATVELHDFHLIIRRHGSLVEAGGTETLVPLSSIKSVTFRRPSTFRSGEFVVFLDGAMLPDTTIKLAKYPTRVLFGSQAASDFEQILAVVRDAVATPSLAQMAMAAQQARSGDRVGSERPPTTNPRLERIDGPTYSPGGTQYDYSAAQPPAPPPPTKPAGSWWSDMPLLGKVILVPMALALLLATCNGLLSDPETPQDGQTAGADAASTETPSGGNLDDGQAMAKEWTSFALGEEAPNGFSLTDGEGRIGEFCSASSGKAVMQFGMNSGVSEAKPYFNSVLMQRLDIDDNVAGVYWFDRDAARIDIYNVSGRTLKKKHQKTAPDFTASVKLIEPGIVEMDGIRFHRCVS